MPRYEIVQDSGYWGVEDLLGESDFTVAYTKGSRYILGTKALTVEKMDALQQDKSVFCIPVYAYIHSGVRLSTGAFSDPWDSGRSGLVYCDKATLARHMHHKRWCARTRQLVEKYMGSYVDAVSKVLDGDVWGYRILDDEGEELDSCYGIVGREEAEQLAKDELEARCRHTV